MRNYEEVLFPQVAKLLTEYVEEETVETIAEPAPRDIVFTGTFEEVNEYYYQELWSDGLPIVPPTVEKVEEFLKYTDRSPDEVLGVYLPANREGTVWKVAVNGVMAGCRPEYMPVLIAIAEAMSDPQYRLVDAGSTPGWEATVFLNGQKLADQLGFNYKEGVRRPGYQANTSVGRFYRLFARNVARLLPGISDKATFGQMFRAAIPENEEVCAELGWEPLSVQQGFEAGDNVVTIMSVRYEGNPQTVTEAEGEKLERIARYIRDTYAMVSADLTPVLLVGPTTAKAITQWGYSYSDLREYLFEHSRIPASDWESRYWPRSACEMVAAGVPEVGTALPELFCESEDPNRLVPVYAAPDLLKIVITGDPARNRVLVMYNNQTQGYITSRKVELPANWDELMTELGK